MDAALWGFIGTVLGACVAIVATVLSNRNARLLQQQSEAFEQAERGRTFQRENLLSVQETLQDAMRSVAKAFHDDEMAAREGVPWGTRLFGDELSEANRRANARLSALTERIADDSLRAAVKSFHLLLNRPTFAKSNAEAAASLNRVMNAHDQLMAELGVVLRRLYLSHNA